VLIWVNYTDSAVKVNLDDLLTSAEVAELIGLSNVRGVSVYRNRHDDFPDPAIDKGGCLLWIRRDIEQWARARG
jgi:predicted DNA-binding transcriptional regulator AlpA